MKVHCLRLLALSSFAALGACADTSGPSGPGVEIGVAPLTLAGVVGVSYGLTVYNAVAMGPGDVVWSQDPVTSGQYGNGGGGSITYIGTCDADTPALGDNLNYVALVLNTITVGDGLGSLGTTFEILDDQNTTTDGDPDFQNPCRAEDPCVLSFPCVENTDTLVQFNITVMRGAEQGFFDIAVNFEDVFCSAKFDSCYDVQTNTDTNAPVTAVKGGETYYRYSTIAAEALKGADVWAVYRQAAWNIYNDRSGAVGSATEFTATGSGGLAELLIATNNSVSANLTLKRATAYSQSGGRPITLLYGPAPGGPRQHTGIAALACTHGADSTGAGADNNETQILMTTPTIVCSDDNGDDVTFAIDIGDAEDGKEGNGSVEDSNTTNVGYELNYGLYFGQELLSCNGGPAGSCNKIYYNIAINLGDLQDQGLTNCKLGYGATAISGANTDTFDNNGALRDRSAQYGAISFGGKGEPISLSNDTGTPACSAFPLNGPGSPVKAGYIKGLGYGTEFEGFKFNYYTNGAAAQPFLLPIIVP